MCSTRIPREWPTAIPLKEMRVPREVRKIVDKMKDTGGAIRWLCWFQDCDGELLSRIFAAKKTKGKGTQLLEVMREVIGVDLYLMRSVFYNGMAGWSCWFPEINEVIDCSWNTYAIDAMPGVWIEMVNPEFVFEMPQFEYCGYRGGFPLAPYLRMYCKEPGIEFFGKMKLRPTPALVKKAKSDPNFRKWLRQLTPEEVSKANACGPAAVMKAYRLHTKDFVGLQNAAAEHMRKCKYAHAYGLGPLLKAGHSAEKVLEYLDDQRKQDKTTTAWQYRDYISACVYLKLDLKDTKNAFPKDLRRMHDRRIAERHSQEAKKDMEKRKQLYKDFAATAARLAFAATVGECYAIVLPKSPADLKKEGDYLHHCVGKCGYDAKMARGETFIAFLRISNKIRKPFVTIEFDLKSRKIRQCYGEHDSRPGEEVLAFANTWADTVKKQLEELDRKQKEELQAATA